MKIKKVIALLAVIVLTLAFTQGCGLKRESKLVKMYKELDLKDFKSQELVGDKNKSEKLAREVYVEPQLSRVLKYLEFLRKNDTKFILYKVDYKKIEIKEQKDDMAKLLVESEVTGDFFTIKYPEKKLDSLVARPLKYEITLKKVNDKWYISDAKPLS
ncbi:hypothetical protein [Carboxydothermus hydrogenoformans]|uniref:Putative lipoprotein n=1 Tax=Carboxydothermus hydrogenoformans (strain ATCC BAA-161 / DSM 6008 / Z-2901) TaxID=246194 RepID=Q3AEF1_CARHZ|nr:hypothetical protein [Carboxydothermus hydrogenoformans]ABB13977.1 putative lipoprotein [Carboxydothermus hydrogenoformans Z-2901]